MAKGIRQFVEARFRKYLPKLQQTGGKQFRRTVLDETVEEFDITMASASAAYNYVLQKFREEEPDAVAGLGRTEYGLNAIEAATQAPSARGRVVRQGVSRQGRTVATATAAGMVTLVKANTGEVVVPSIPRNLANGLIASAGSGRGRAKLAIQQDLQ